MHIINCTSIPRAYSYASQTTGGKRLEPNAASSEFPLSKIFDPLIQKDINNGVCILRLSEKDKDFLNWLMNQALKPFTPVSKPVTAPKLPTDVKPSVKQAKSFKLSVKAQEEIRKKAEATLATHTVPLPTAEAETRDRNVPAGLPSNAPGTPIGQPDLGQTKPSLAQLRKMNAQKGIASPSIPSISPGLV